MGIPLGSNFTVNTGLPLDDRIIVADNTARDAIDAGRRYEGLLVYSVGAGTNYQLVGGILNANWTELSGSGGGTTVVVNRFSGDASTVAFVLGSDPITEENTQVYINGVYQQKDTYSTSGTTLTFSQAPPVGTNNIEVTYFTAFSVASLPANAVGTTQVQDNSVTPAKLSAVNMQTAAIASYTNNTTTYTTAATVTITTSGRMCEWGIYHNSSSLGSISVSSTSSVSLINARFRIYDTVALTELSTVLFGPQIVTPVNGYNYYPHLGAYGFLNLAAGTYTLNLDGRCSGATLSLQAGTVIFYVREL